MRNLTLAGLFLSAFMLVSLPARAQSNGATVVSGNTCPVSAVLNSGNSRPLIETQYGQLCTQIAGGTITATFTPAPATPVSTAALAANLVVNGAPSTLFSFNVSADSTLSAAAWWVMIYNSTTAPADGAVTPLKCYAMPLGTTAITGAFPQGVTLSTGAVIGVSTTGCFTKTASTHAFISGDYR